MKRAPRTPTHIYYIYEGAGQAWNHKIHTVLVQACLASQGGVSSLCAKTGAGLMPQLFLHTLDEDFILPLVHAGGFSCHGLAPLVNHPVDKGHFEPRTVLFYLSGHELQDINVDAGNGRRGRQKHRRI